MRHSDKVINKALVTISDKDRTFIRRYNSSPRQQTVVVFASVCPIQYFDMPKLPALDAPIQGLLLIHFVG